MITPEFGTSKHVQLVFTTPEKGWFGVNEEQSADEIKWYHCREQFQSILGLGVDGFYFAHNPDGEVNLASFLLSTEEILELNNYSKFSKTNKKFITWVNPSPFWMQCEMRKSLLTILLRCGMKFDYSKNNFEQALFSLDYTKKTELAVKRFLFGFTKFIKSKDEKIGWVSIFKNQEVNFVKRKLILPDDKNAEETVVGTNSLWT